MKNSWPIRVKIKNINYHELTMNYFCVYLRFLREAFISKEIRSRGLLFLLYSITP